MKSGTYRLTLKLYNMLKNRRNVNILVCSNCGRPLKAWVVTKKRTNTAKLYGRECALKLGVI